jgi:hypothetical protein
LLSTSFAKKSKLFGFRNCKFHFLVSLNLPNAIKSKLNILLPFLSGCNPLKKSTNHGKEISLHDFDNTLLSKD